MAIKIRLRRMGRKKQPHYRVVVADTDSPRDGRFVEALGYYRPLSHPARFVVDMERVEYWLGKGAQPSGTVASLLKRVARGGDDTIAVEEGDTAAERQAKMEALAERRRKEAEKVAEEEAAAAAAAAEAAKAAEKEAEEPVETEAEADEAPAEEEAAPEAEAKPAEEEAPVEEPAAEEAEAEDTAEDEEKSE
jgi:small subunit ribosomal protein S16